MDVASDSPIASHSCCKSHSSPIPRLAPSMWHMPNFSLWTELFQEENGRFLPARKSAMRRHRQASGTHGCAGTAAPLCSEDTHYLAFRFLMAVPQVCGLKPGPLEGKKNLNPQHQEQENRHCLTLLASPVSRVCCSMLSRGKRCLEVA